MLKNDKNNRGHLSYIDEEEKNFDENNNQTLNINENTKYGNNMSKSENNFFSNRQRETEECRLRLTTIANVLPDLKRDYFISLDQKISYIEFISILKKYDISYPKDIIISLLNFLDIPDINAFTLREFVLHVKACRILMAEITL